MSAATECARASRAHSSQRPPVLRPGTTARTAHSFPRTPAHPRTPPSGTAKATRFPHRSALPRPPPHTNTGPSADQRIPEHFQTRAISGEGKGCPPPPRQKPETLWITPQGL
ncbi:hypothetical protein Srubr_66040 [Streptomyces rubradiris]|uniref:Uncharacterized protein n=1 Tax=Streptomyces rubradiris TaxID=285531 RepID=A0ABQ3RLL4_STRRR|nr:hypothetical protein GCM10018792_32770 [Streptomyces rubradiris]GHI56758.1 hypothetical protein Srubr_66040 [Streptomyces rubradiris]